MKKTLMILLMIAVFPSVVSAIIIPKAKGTIKVLDTEGNLLPGARIHVSFPVPLYVEFGNTVKTVIDYSDKKGLLTVSGKSLGGFGFSAIKEGFYRSRSGVKFKDVQDYLFYKRWLPWNPTIEIVLREKRNPMKMYSKGTGYIKVPVQNQPVGYDLVEGDWVEPYGKGKIKDFIINFSSEDRGIDDWRAEYTLSFSNKGDGMQVYEPDPMIQSEFKLPYEAPVEGYLIKKLNKYARYFNEFDPKKDAMNTNIKRKRTYIFRVRTKTSENGNVTGGMYGLMSRDIIATSDGEVDIGYALNPSNRSLEYGGNLFEESGY